jgi:GNAT superfamily N-acetyltransferase
MLGHFSDDTTWRRLVESPFIRQIKKARKTMSEKITVRRVHATDAMDCVDALADVLIDCVEGGASVSFMLPISRGTAVQFWRRIAGGVERNERILLIAENEAHRIVGTVQLVIDQPENQPHRAEVAKMLVHREARRQGVARRLMAAADDAAREAGKSVLVLDTVTGGDAERLYERAGWQRVGVIPNYALMPDGEFCSTTFFHKQLPSR